MLSNFLNLDGVTVLDKKQQSKVSGGVGGQECAFRIDNGEWGHNWIFSDGEAGSKEARDLCSEMVQSGNVSRCQYDCEYDGWGH